MGACERDLCQCRCEQQAGGGNDHGQRGLSLGGGGRRHRPRRNPPLSVDVLRHVIGELQQATGSLPRGGSRASSERSSQATTEAAVHVGRFDGCGDGEWLPFGSLLQRMPRLFASLSLANPRWAG